MYQYTFPRPCLLLVCSNGASRQSPTGYVVSDSCGDFRNVHPCAKRRTHPSNRSIFGPCTARRTSRPRGDAKTSGVATRCIRRSIYNRVGRQLKSRPGVAIVRLTASSTPTFLSTISRAHLPACLSLPGCSNSPKKHRRGRQEQRHGGAPAGDCPANKREKNNARESKKTRTRRR